MGQELGSDNPQRCPPASALHDSVGSRERFRKSPERQRGAQWLLIRVSFQVFPPFHHHCSRSSPSSLSSVTHLCHSKYSWGARSEDWLNLKVIVSPPTVFPNSVHCTEKSKMLWPGQLTRGSFRGVEKLGSGYQRHFWNPPAQAMLCVLGCHFQPPHTPWSPVRTGGTWT